MSGGRTHYWPKDNAWWRRTRIIKLGREHGAAGPAVVDWLTCEARAQGPIDTHDGSVKAGYAAVEWGCFVQGGEDEVRRIVQTAVRVGLLDDFDEVDDDVFVCRISGWAADVNTPLQTAARAGRARGKPTEPANTTDHPSVSGDVRDRPEVSGAVRREENVEGEERREDVSDETSAARARPRPSDDEPPSDLPEHLVTVADVVRRHLQEVAEHRQGCKPVTLLGAGRVVRDHPRHDHARHVAACAGYYLDGKGAKTRPKDMLARYRQWLSREDEDAAPIVSGRPKAVVSASVAVEDEQAAAGLDAAERRRVAAVEQAARYGDEPSAADDDEFVVLDPDWRSRL